MHNAISSDSRVSMKCLILGTDASQLTIFNLCTGSNLSFNFESYDEPEEGTASLEMREIGAEQKGELKLRVVYGPAYHENILNPQRFNYSINLNDFDAILYSIKLSANLETVLNELEIFLKYYLQQIYKPMVFLPVFLALDVSSEQNDIKELRELLIPIIKLCNRYSIEFIEYIGHDKKSVNELVIKVFQQTLEHRNLGVSMDNLLFLHLKEYCNVVRDDIDRIKISNDFNLRIIFKDNESTSFKSLLSYAAAQRVESLSVVRSSILRIDRDYGTNARKLKKDNNTVSVPANYLIDFLSETCNLSYYTIAYFLGSKLTERINDKLVYLHLYRGKIIIEPITDKGNETTQEFDLTDGVKMLRELLMLTKNRGLLNGLGSLMKKTRHTGKYSVSGFQSLVFELFNRTDVNETQRYYLLPFVVSNELHAGAALWDKTKLQRFYNQISKIQVISNKQNKSFLQTNRNFCELIFQAYDVLTIMINNLFRMLTLDDFYNGGAAYTAISNFHAKFSAYVCSDVANETQSLAIMKIWCYFQLSILAYLKGNYFLQALLTRTLSELEVWSAMMSPELNDIQVFFDKLLTNRTTYIKLAIAYRYNVGVSYPYLGTFKAQYITSQEMSAAVRMKAMNRLSRQLSMILSLYQKVEFGSDNVEFQALSQAIDACDVESRLDQIKRIRALVAGIDRFFIDLLSNYGIIYDVYSTVTEVLNLYKTTCKEKSEFKALISVLKFHELSIGLSNKGDTSFITAVKCQKTELAKNLMRYSLFSMNVRDINNKNGLQIYKDEHGLNENDDIPRMIKSFAIKCSFE
ncbi:MAG: hypothetical protein AB7F64_01490 [Gammaproteobacteria bacterium]